MTQRRLQFCAWVWAHSAVGLMDGAETPSVEACLCCLCFHALGPRARQHMLGSHTQLPHSVHTRHAQDATLNKGTRTHSSSSPLRTLRTDYMTRAFAKETSTRGVRTSRRKVCRVRTEASVRPQAATVQVHCRGSTLGDARDSLAFWRAQLPKGRPDEMC